MSVLVIFFKKNCMFCLLLLLSFFCMINLLKSDSTIHPYFRLYCYPDEDTYYSVKTECYKHSKFSLKCGQTPLQFLFCDKSDCLEASCPS